MPPVDEVPFLLMIAFTPALSVALRLIVNDVPLVISGLDESVKV